MYNIQRREENTIVQKTRSRSTNAHTHMYPLGSHKYTELMTEWNINETFEF